MSLRKSIKNKLFKFNLKIMQKSRFTNLYDLLNARRANRAWKKRIEGFFIIEHSRAGVKIFDALGNQIIHEETNTP